MITACSDLDAAGLAALFADLGEKPFRAKQVSRWVHQRLVDGPDAMTDLSARCARRLAEIAAIRGPTVIGDATASDGTRKWLLDVGAGNAVEAVYIPEDDRGTLCISSQAGCALDCAFCSTGKQGFNRNLTTGEIVGQLWHAESRAARRRQSVTAPWVEQGRAPITNVVLMGMGEPLANYDNVVTALRLMLDDNAYGLSRRRVTLSTSGLVPAIDRLREDCPVALAVSLHAGNDPLRDRARADQPQVSARASSLAACVRYLDRAPRDFVTFEYVMLDGVNDSVEQASELAALVRDVPCKFNLIPWNPFPGADFRDESRSRILAFQQRLIDAGFVTTIRKTRGEDIDAACGQLAGRVQDRTKRQIRLQRAPPARRPLIGTRPGTTMNPKLRRVAAAVALSALVALFGGCASTQSSSPPAPPRAPDAAAHQGAGGESQGSGGAHADLGAGYYERGRMDVAIEELTEAATLDPTNPRIYNYFGLVYAMLGENAKAEQNFQRALSLAPDDSDVRHNWGWYLCSNERPRESIPEFEIALRNPFYKTPEVALTNAGRCSAAFGDIASAEAFYRRALARSPANAPAMYGLALLAFKGGRLDEARG